MDPNEYPKVDLRMRTQKSNKYLSVDLSEHPKVKVDLKEDPKSLTKYLSADTCNHVW